MDNIRKILKTISDNILNLYDLESPVDQIWSSIKDGLTQALKQVPTSDLAPAPLIRLPILALYKLFLD